MKRAFQMPTVVKITGRASSITNSFVNSIIPVVKPSDDEVTEALAILGMKRNNVRCAYCGDRATEWDHLRPLVKGKLPTGYISEIANLVPACGKCNQSKGGRPWEDWILGDAALSPKTRGKRDLKERIRRLKAYEKRMRPTRVRLRKIVHEKTWARHWANLDKLHDLMRTCQKVADEIRKAAHEQAAQRRQRRQRRRKSPS